MDGCLPTKLHAHQIQDLMDWLRGSKGLYRKTSGEVSL